jgi:hypothetical protein
MGDVRITIAILDGLVDQSHPCFNGANLTQLPTLVSGEANQGKVLPHSMIRMTSKYSVGTIK